MRLFELGTRPWEAMDEEERKRILIYEAFCTATVVNNNVREATAIAQKEEA